MDISQSAIKTMTRLVRRYLVGPEQHWVFERPPANWQPQPIAQSSLYLHVPFCRHFCPYCPYTKVAYQESFVEPYTRAAIAEVDWWQHHTGNIDISSIYIGGGTPTLALDSVSAILAHIRKRFRLQGNICIETNPADVNEDVVRQLKDMGIDMVSLGVESFRPENLAVIGRDYTPATAERALALLAGSGFHTVNTDIMFALPHQTEDSLVADLSRAVELGADQITTYPLFTFPYTSVGTYMHLTSLRMPNLKTRRAHYRTIHRWCTTHNFERVSVWGFKHSSVGRYSSVTRDGYIGIGPGAGSHLPDGFVLNTFDLQSWMQALSNGESAVALRMPFAAQMAGWWWLYWRFYDTRIPLDCLDEYLANDATKARRWLKIIQKLGLAYIHDGQLELNEAGAFWLHLAQNYFALNYVNTLWTQARQQAFPADIFI